MNGLNVLVSLLNDAAVSVFGSLLSASFCGDLSNWRKRRIFWIVIVLMRSPRGRRTSFGARNSG